MIAGFTAAGAALAAEAGVVVALLVYSSVGSFALVTLTLAWPERPDLLVAQMDGQALA